MNDPADLPEDVSAIAERLRRRMRRQLPQDGAVAAAVLVPLVWQDGTPALLLTKRSETVAQHKGQVSFPGGARDAGDSDVWQTALRETHEEIGLPPDRIVPLAQLDDLVTVTGFHVTPCVGFVRSLAGMKPAPAEIADWFVVALAKLRAPGMHEIRQIEWQGRQHAFHLYHTQPHEVWGATAAILAQLLRCLQGVPLP